MFDINKERQDKVASLWWTGSAGTEYRLIKPGGHRTDVLQQITRMPLLCLPRCAWAAATMREQDEKICAAARVGRETCGASGMAYGMRTIFPMIKLIDDVEKVCPRGLLDLRSFSTHRHRIRGLPQAAPRRHGSSTSAICHHHIDVVAAAADIQGKERRSFTITLA